MYRLPFHWALALLVSGFFVAGSCSSGSDTECTTAMDCPGTQDCVNGECVDSPCGSGCPGGQYCNGTECVDCTDDRHCGANCIDCTVLATDHACVAGSCGCDTTIDCASGQQCVDRKCAGDCVPDCSGKCGGASDGCEGTCDQACPSGQWCDAQACSSCDSDTHCGPDCTDCTSQMSNRVCVDDACGCVDENDCDAGEVCEAGTCLASGCQDDSQCPGGRWCSDGVCVLCNSNEHCGWTCSNCTTLSNNMACVSGVCGCNDVGDCTQGEACQDGTCTGCQPDCTGLCGGASDGCTGTCEEDCPTGQQCLANLCEPLSCVNDDDCPQGFLCIADQCADYRCQTDDDCSGVSVCLNGTCIEPECNELNPCDAGQWCNDYACAPCISDDHCGNGCLDCTSQDVPGEVCENLGDGYQCVCTSDQSCAQGTYCAMQGAGFGLCAQCDNDAHCGTNCQDCTSLSNNQACVNGYCGCISNDDCTEGDICQDGVCTGCQPDCTGKCGGADDGCGGSCTGDCDIGQWCNDSTCSPCTTNSHCGPTCLDCTSHLINGDHCLDAGAAGYFCACGSDAGCLPANWCNGAPDGVCTACDTAEHCGNTCADCAGQADNQACVDGSCGCLTIQDCSAGKVCTNGQCTVTAQEDCSNDVDDDLDQLTDCEDTQDCPEYFPCGSTRRCEGGNCVVCAGGPCDSDIDCLGCGNFNVCSTEMCCATCRHCLCP